MVKSEESNWYLSGTYLQTLKKVKLPGFHLLIYVAFKYFDPKSMIFIA